MSEDKGRTVLPEVVGLLKVMIQRQDDTNAALKALAQDTHAGFKALAEEVRGIRSDLQAGLARQDEHAARLAKLEAAVFPPTPPRPARRPGARR